MTSAIGPSISRPGCLFVVVPKWKVKVITKFVTIFIDRICRAPNDRPKPPRAPITYGPPRHSEA